jgi:mercuric ion transport protein
MFFSKFGNSILNEQIMVFFFFSLLASLLGSISAGQHYSYSLNVHLTVNNPFSGIIAYWPFIVGLAIILLAILWYQTLRAMKRNNSHPTRKHRYGSQSKVWLGILTVLVLFLIVSPYVLQQLGAEEQTVSSAEDRVEMILTVHGMDCTGCESTVNRKVGELPGIENVSASHTREEVMVVYDKSRVSLEQIAQVIESSGYTVILE